MMICENFWVTGETEDMQLDTRPCRRHLTEQTTLKMSAIKICPLNFRPQPSQKIYLGQSKWRNQDSDLCKNVSNTKLLKVHDQMHNCNLRVRMHDWMPGLYMIVGPWIQAALLCNYHNNINISISALCTMYYRNYH